MEELTTDSERILARLTSDTRNIDDPRGRYWLEETLSQAQKLSIDKRRVAHSAVFDLLDAFEEGDITNLLGEFEQLAEETANWVEALERQKQTDRNINVFFYSAFIFLIGGIILSLMGVSGQALVIGIPIAITSVLGLLNIALTFRKLFSR